jgi:hypothetical protein
VRRVTKKTVLVLGAGASCEVNLPSGDRLKGEISSLLTYRVSDGSLQQIDSEIHHAYQSLARNSADKSLNPYLTAARKIIAGLPLVLSIDNFLDIRRGDLEVEVCGKLAIARAILRAEAASKLAISRERDGISMPSIQATWFAKFFQLLCEGCPESDLPARLRSIALVVFNYDRCFEHFLYHALQTAYGVDQAQAASLVSEVEIYHSYGTVGALPWQLDGTLPWTATGPRIPFGGGTQGMGSDLLAIAKNLKTFTESTDAAIVESVRKLIANSDRLIFLGFAYHKLNLLYLFGPESQKKTARGSCFGSSYGMSPNNVQSIESDLMQQGHFIRERIVLSNSLCADFVNDNSRLFSFR